MKITIKDISNHLEELFESGVMLYNLSMSAKDKIIDDVGEEKFNDKLNEIKRTMVMDFIAHALIDTLENQMGDKIDKLIDEVQKDALETFEKTEYEEKCGKA